MTPQSLEDFMGAIQRRDPGQPEFLQAVREVVISLWPFLEKNPRYREYGVLERLCEPDVTLWFDLPVAVAAQRLAGARSPDRFEAQSQAFFERVSAAYAARAAQAPQRFVRIDAAQSLAHVAQQLQQALCQRGCLKAVP